MLTDTAIRKAQPQERPYRMADAGGLSLLLTPTGGKLWRYRYRIDGKDKDAGDRRLPGRHARPGKGRPRRGEGGLRLGRDPSVWKRVRADEHALARGHSFEVIAREWHELNKGKWAEIHAADILHSLKRDVFPELGDVPIRDITPSMTLRVLQAVEKRAAIETAKRLRQRMSAVFVFAIASGRGEADPAALVQSAMAPLVKGRQPAVTDLAEARAILQRVDQTPAHPATKLALRLLALTALRP